MNDTTRHDEITAEAGLVGVAAVRLVPHTPAPPPPDVMARARLVYEQKQQAQTDARLAWQERQRIEDEERRKRGMERAARAQGEYRDWLEQKDKERR